jgi:hypothetical protein
LQDHGNHITIAGPGYQDLIDRHSDGKDVDAMNGHFRDALSYIM